MATIFGCLYEVHIGMTWRIRLNHPCAAAMRLFCHITRVRTIVQKTDSPIVDSIGQNYRPMR